MIETIIIGWSIVHPFFLDARLNSNMSMIGRILHGSGPGFHQFLWLFGCTLRNFQAFEKKQHPNSKIGFLLGLYPLRALCISDVGSQRSSAKYSFIYLVSSTATSSRATDQFDVALVTEPCILGLIQVGKQRTQVVNRIEIFILVPKKQ